MRSASMRRSTSPPELFPGVLDDDVEQLQHLAVGGLVELEVERPDVIRSLRWEPVRRARRGPETPTLSLPVRYFQALLAPQTLDLLAVSVPGLRLSAPPTPSIAAAFVLAAELAQPGSEGVVALAAHDRAALGGTMLTDDLTRPPLRQLEAVLQHHDRTPSAPDFFLAAPGAQTRHQNDEDDRYPQDGELPRAPAPSGRNV